MTNPPGDDQSQPQEPGPPEPGPEPGPEQPGYWEQQAQSQQQPYSQQPYPQQPYPQSGYAPQAPGQYAPDHPRATTVLVLGILSVVLCQVLGPFAWVMGKKTVEEIDASGGAIGGRGAANAGYVLGIVATVLLGLSLLVLVALIGFGIIGAVTSSSFN